MIRSIAVLPSCFASEVHVSGSNPKAASVSSALFIIMKCLSLPAPLWWNDLVSLREESLLVFQAENSTFFYDVLHVIVSLLSNSLSQHHQQPPDSLLTDAHDQCLVRASISWFISRDDASSFSSVCLHGIKCDTWGPVLISTTIQSPGYKIKKKTTEKFHQDVFLLCNFTFTLRNKNHLVSVRRTTWCRLTHLFWSPRSQMEKI